MLKYIDQKQLVTLIVAAVAIFFLQKWLTKKVTKPDGTVVSYAGHDAVGFI